MHLPGKRIHPKSDILPISEQLLAKYNVIFKGHVESEDIHIPEQVIVPPESVETQDLIIVSDIVLTDYSSIIFDALTINKRYVFIHLSMLNMLKNVACMKMYLRALNKYGTQMQHYSQII